MELAEICNLLKKARKEKKISLQDVSKHTKLPPSILRKIEEIEGLEKVGRFYIKGFLKIYAQFLNQDNLVKEIEEYFSKEKPKKPFRIRKEKLTSIKEYQPLKKMKEEQKKALIKPQAEETKPIIPKIPLKKNTSNIRLNKKVVSLVILGLLFLFFIFSFLKNSKKQIHPSSIKRKEAKPQKNLAIFPKEANIKPLVSILTKGRVFVEVKRDGKLIFQNIIIKGNKESWQAQQKLEIKISNPSLVSLEIGNQIIPTSNIKKPTSYIVTPEGFQVKK